MQSQQYHPLAKYLHWIIAGMIVLQFVIAKVAEDTESPIEELTILANHKSIGITIFVLALVRLAWRLRQGVPRALPMPEWQFIASQISHWSMYALIFLLPITGWLTSSASDQSVSWFNVLPLPDLVAPDPDLEEKFEEIHELHATLLLVIAAIHIAAAVVHSMKKEMALSRITSTGPIIAFVAVIIVGSLTLTRGGTPSTVAVDDSGTTLFAAWNIDYDASHIRFTAKQAGEAVSGEWQEWRADLRFDAARLDKSLVDVHITVASVETLDDERDMALQDAEWFDGENYPEVRYHASRFRRTAGGYYEALGALTVKGRSVPVTLDFTMSDDDGRYVLDGTAQLDRLELDLGLVEFSDIRWIGRPVTVDIHVEANAGD